LQLLAIADGRGLQLLAARCCQYRPVSTELLAARLNYPVISPQ
jgi:hypothetical protein